MIHYFVTKSHFYTVVPFLKQWDCPVRRHFQIIPYEHIGRLRRIEPGLFVFSDLDRISPPYRKELAAFADRLATHFGPETILNHPAGFLPRDELLEALHAEGINDFRTFPAESPDETCRFPVFLRRRNDHRGPITPLLENRDEWAIACRKLRRKGVPLDEVIAVEYCETRGRDGLYRKYSAFCVDEAVVPWHIIFSTNWVTKDSRPEPLRQEERDFFDRNPHQELIRQAFRLAGLRYGRIDYGVKDGRVRVWEINSNPAVISPPHKFTSDKRPLRQAKIDEMSRALESLHARALDGRTVLELGEHPLSNGARPGPGRPEVNIDGLSGLAHAANFWVRKYLEELLYRSGLQA